jgi:hypothetical protein
MEGVSSLDFKRIMVNEYKDEKRILFEDKGHSSMVLVDGVSVAVMTCFSAFLSKTNRPLIFVSAT